MIEDYATTTVIWEAISRDVDGVQIGNGEGDPNFLDPVTLPARVQYEEKVLKSTQTGQNKVSNTQIFVDPQYQIATGDRVTVKGIKLEAEIAAHEDMFEDSDHIEILLV